MGRTDGIHSVCPSLSVIDRRQRRSDWELINAESAEICIFNNVWRYSHWAVMSWPQCKQQPVGVILLWPSYHGTLPHTHTFPDKCQTLACLESPPPPTTHPPSRPLLFCSFEWMLHSSGVCVLRCMKHMANSTETTRSTACVCVCHVTSERRYRCRCRLSVFLLVHMCTLLFHNTSSHTTNLLPLYRMLLRRRTAAEPSPLWLPGSPTTTRWAWTSKSGHPAFRWVLADLLDTPGLWIYTEFSIRFRANNKVGHTYSEKGFPSFLQALLPSKTSKDQKRL